MTGLAEYEVRALLRDVLALKVTCTPETFTRVAFDDVTLNSWPPCLSDPFWMNGYGYDARYAPPWVEAHLETMSGVADMLRPPRNQKSLHRLRDVFFAACAELLSRMEALPDRPKEGVPLSGAARTALEEVNAFVGEVRSYAETAAYANHLLVTPGIRRANAKELLLLYLWRDRGLPDDAKTERGKVGKLWGGKRAEVIRYDALREYVYVRTYEFKKIRQKYDASDEAKAKRAERRSDPNVLHREKVKKAKARAAKKGKTPSNDTAPALKLVVGGRS